MQIASIGFVTVALAFITPLTSDVVLTNASYATIKAKIVPRADDEEFLAIPWRAALWPALEEARGADLPVLLWAMNGHPLGCT